MAVMMAMFLGLLWLGLYPQPVFDMARPTFDRLQESAIVRPLQAETTPVLRHVHVADSQERP
jgi:NADH-quinone oxidoreductase subunit M